MAAMRRHGGRAYGFGSESGTVPDRTYAARKLAPCGNDQPAARTVGIANTGAPGNFRPEGIVLSQSAKSTYFGCWAVPDAFFGPSPDFAARRHQRHVDLILRKLTFARASGLVFDPSAMEHGNMTPFHGLEEPISVALSRFSFFDGAAHETNALNQNFR